MNKDLVFPFVGKLVRISMGDNNFVPPPGRITMISEDSFLFETTTKTSVLSIKELKEISPVI